MNILITRRLVLQLHPQFSTQNFIFHPSPLGQKNPNFINLSPRKCSFTTKMIPFCSTAASASVDYYGGWDHPQLGGNFDHSSEYDQLRSFLGFGDKKYYVFVYLLGFICALAISRVKVSSIIGFPACAIVFAVGFSVGFSNGGHISFSGAKKRPKDENLKESIGKMRDLVDLLSGFDAKFVSLKNGIKDCIDCNQVSLNDLGTFLKNLESINLDALDAKSIAEDCIGNILPEIQDTERNLSQKSSRKKKEVGDNGFSFRLFFVNLFQEKPKIPKPIKMRDLSKRELKNVEVNHREQGNILASSVEERTSKSLYNRSAENENEGLRGPTYQYHNINRGKANNLVNGARRMNVVAENEYLKYAETRDAVKEVLKSNKYTYQKRRLDCMSNQEVSWKQSHAREVERWSSHDRSLESMDFRVSLKHRKTETSFGQEEKRDDLAGNFEDFDSVKRGENEDYGSFIRGESVISDTQHSQTKDGYTVASEDMEFSRCLAEANVLLKEAKECLVLQGDDEVAEKFLCKSAELLLQALNIRPMSLLAVGQLGNTYLLHGELKLRLSRQLRALLTGNEASADKWDTAEDLVSRNYKISSILADVCEECEELLINAGRKYRLALSIDGNDVRAMYNWGLALFFRAQLLADVGPGAAPDADEVFLAAIDKFDAMMSKSNIHAPDALFRWGAALQQRSRLRPRKSKEKVKLLQQARRLYEDALDFDSENVQVREALSSCVSELKYWHD
ncbi:uncharacterized protein [Coffea arabica]|uniref:Uncharacterized protein n=1 Tax=Coffea arabica TaxID=13443 RepID=A0A6P6WB03_COFAR|nr:uncharacterized protein LOC113730957 [Coffea arabica]